MTAVDARPIRVSPERLGEYFVKTARGGHLVLRESLPWRPVPVRDPPRDAVETYDAEDVELQASHGRKQLTSSTGRMDLRAFAVLGREATDETIAAEDLGGANVIALVLRRQGRRLPLRASLRTVRRR